MAENSVKYMPPNHHDGFFGIQKLQISILARAVPDTAGGADDVSQTL